LYKEFGNDIKKLLVAVKKSITLVPMSVNPAAQPDKFNTNIKQAVTPQNPQGTCTLQMQTTATAGLEGWIWLKAPNCLLDVTATPGSVTDAQGNFYAVLTCSGMSSPMMLTGMTRYMGWVKSSQFTNAGFYPGFAQELKKWPTIGYSAAVWYDPGFTGYQYMKVIAPTPIGIGAYPVPGKGFTFGVTQVHFANNGAVPYAQAELWSSSNWSR